MKKRWVKLLTVICAVLAAAVLGFLIFAGWAGYFGPFKGLSVTRIQLAYRDRPTGEIVFYGASNFALWKEMEQDMLPLAAQNHGFGGSVDNDLMREAEKLLYPYKPSAVVFQSGSNDFIYGMRAEDVIANKQKMFAIFRERLPDAPFVVMSMIPMPGRAQYWADCQTVNAFLKAFCAGRDDITFVDATDILTAADGGFRPEIFNGDGVHLNRDGRLLWGARIKEALTRIVGR